MNSSSAAMTGLARQLIQLEAANGAAPGQPAGMPHAAAAPGPNGTSQILLAVMVVEKLRTVLVRFSGPAAFSALLRRALSRAKLGNPALEPVHVEPDGALTGFAELGDDHAAAAVISYLLELLATFVGHGVMLKLLAEAWPNELAESPLKNRDHP